MNKPSPKTAVINKSWLQLTDSLSNNYHNKWICDESWCRIMCSQFPHLLGAFSLKRTNLVQCILRLVGGFDTQNANGVYHKAFKSVCPYGGSCEIRKILIAYNLYYLYARSKISENSCTQQSHPDGD